ncbi:MAG: TIGR04283 family arsenosugar biosynthesis glycosyltransferase [Magnetovibrio sp.]|nr:TIGR04283 family arsenosugar biosynthesis glycosyltransferase [Magnetovibrio sp.]
MKVSVIIPALNEAPRLPALAAALAAEPVDHEVILVDGGSRDDTVATARRLGFRVLETEPGRGRQLAAGAAAARGQVFWFVHADTRLPASALAAVAAELGRRPGAVGGNFRLLFDGDDGFSRWLDGFYAWIRARGFYYGDSGVFVRRWVYEALGGIRPIALMEDYDFNRRMEEFGDTICISEPPLVSSSRRFRGRRPAAIVIGWFLIHGLFHLGVSPDRLAAWYDSARRRQRAQGA